MYSPAEAQGLAGSCTHEIAESNRDQQYKPRRLSIYRATRDADVATFGQYRTRLLALVRRRGTEARIDALLERAVRAWGELAAGVLALDVATVEPRKPRPKRRRGGQGSAGVR